MIDAILQAMRADCVPAGISGLWEVKRGLVVGTEHERRMFQLKNNFPSCEFPPPDTYTYLLRWTLATQHKSHGELVMNDFPGELKKHLDFVLKAGGRVLVTGLGLGCVVRGLLAHGRVSTIDVIERDPDVIKLCAGSVESPKVRIIQADARDWSPDGQYDFGWHDLWSDPDKDEENLALTHFKLMDRLAEDIPRQGAWAMPRRFTRRLPEFRLGKS